MPAPAVVPADLRLSRDDAPAAADRAFINRMLEQLNLERWPTTTPPGSFAIFLRDGAGAVEAGIDLYHYGGWLFVHNLWVAEQRRGAGLGSLLMQEAEARARELGCHSAWLDTFSFQARGFYRKLGYEEFGTLEYPPGAARHFLRKRIDGEAPG